MGEYLTKETGNRIVRLVIGVSLLLMFVIFLSYYQSISDRNSLADFEENARQNNILDQRAGCERNKKDRRAAIQARADINCIKAFPLAKKDVD